MKKWKKYVFLSHRYLGIFLAPFILLWSISGIVMMYVAYPKLTESERLHMLPPLGGFECCDQRFLERIEHLDVAKFSLERLEGSVVARMKTTTNEYVTFQLSTSRSLIPIDEARAREIFKDNFSKSFESSNKNIEINNEKNKRKYKGENKEEEIEKYEKILNIEKIERDQWTVYSSYNRHRPLYKIILGDDEGREVYISSISGKIVQQTTSFQRNWSWIGTVTHWLYPTALRQYTQLWYWLVVGLSIASLIAVISGVWIGLKQLKKRKSKPLSPYKGMRLLHHWGGVFIALILFLFLLSGFLSMNPLGLFQSKHYSITHTLGKKVEPRAVIDSLQHYLPDQFDSELVQLSLAGWNNEVYWIGKYRNGHIIRYDKHFKQYSISRSELIAAGVALGGPQVSQMLLSVEDDYYFSHKNIIELPVWKMTTNNQAAGEVLFYLSPITGEMIKSVDSQGRLYRWLFNALHRWDFSSTTRQRPISDFLLVPFMALLVIFSLTGCYLGWKRLRRS